MKVLLVNPVLKTWSPNVYPPLGLCYIAAALEQAGHEVSILDMNARKVSDAKLVRHAGQSDLVGITGLVTEYNEVVRLVKAIKESTGTTIVLGGPLATTHPTEMLLSSGADIIVIGEGEQTAVELASTIKDKGDMGSVKGILRLNGNSPLFSPLRAAERELNNIPHPARHLLDMSRYSTHHFKTFGIAVPKTKSTTLISSRGCPYQCTFCYHDLQGKKWRGRNPDDIIAEMARLWIDYDITGFVFNDDTFVLDRGRVVDFCKKLLHLRSFGIENFSWYCNGRVNLMDEELLNLMAESGCVGIAYGIESGNQAILDSVKKGITLEQVERVTGLTKRAGIHVTGYFMLGILGETRQSIQETLDFAEKLDLNFYGFGITSPIPGTEMYAEAVEKGLVEQGSRLEDWSFHAWVNLTEDCSKEELERLNEYAFRKFTIERRWGKHYLWNWKLWWEGLRTLVFLARKRNVSELLRKVIGLLRN